MAAPRVVEPQDRNGLLRRCWWQPGGFLAQRPSSSPALPSACACAAGLYFQEHPIRNRAVIGEQTGKMTLVTLPPVGSRAAAKPIATFLDLSGRVRQGTETGLLSFAFHPQFAKNGRFFVSYICNSNDHPDCKVGAGCTAGQPAAAGADDAWVCGYESAEWGHQ